MKKNRLLLLVLLAVGLMTGFESQAQNLLNLEGWTVGTGSSGIFGMNGQESENSREWGIGPGGKRVVLWKAAPSGMGGASGGWDSSLLPINHVNMYRFSVWLKRTGAFGGGSYFGCKNVSSLNGVFDDNPYFWSGNLPKLDQWYLLVGYVHGSGDNSTIHYGGIYDGLTGEKVVGINDFKFQTGAPFTNHRSYLYYDLNVNNRQYFYAPRIDLVNGNEPSIVQLLGIQKEFDVVTYFPGKVGVRTNNPGDYDLAVKGKVHAQEIKVDIDQWPDYVFKKEYLPLSLKEVEKHIHEKGHLPGIPSAKEVENHGIELGAMNKKLLEKIEELTLYLIELKKDNEKMNNRLILMEKNK